MALTPLPMLRVAESLLLPAVSTAVRTLAGASALALMTDFLVTAAASIEASASLGEAERRMLDGGLGLLIVLDESCCVMGVIDARDLRGERVTWPAEKTAREPRQLRVADVMKPLPDLDALELKTFEAATPRQVLKTLQQSDREHLLVVELSGTAVTARLRGVVTRTQAELLAGALSQAASPLV